jgi:catalase
MPVPKTGKAPAPKPAGKTVKTSPALSMIGTQPADSIVTRKIAILAADGVDGAAIAAMKTALTRAGAVVNVLAPHLGSLKATGGAVAVDHRLVTMPSVVYDAVFVPGGKAAIAALQADGDAVHFVSEAFKHAKAIAATGDGVDLLRTAGIPDGVAGVISGSGPSLARTFISAIAQHRAWDRGGLQGVPA